MESVVAAVADLFHATHQEMRAQITGLDATALNWAPAPDTNSIAVLVIHTLGSEADVLHVVRGQTSDRDRPAEFRSHVTGTADLLHRIDEADRLLDRMAAEITAEDLAANRVRATVVTSQEARTGTYWLVQNCAHAREHLGQISLTKQLYEQRS